jgi:hypothetical protein
MGRGDWAFLDIPRAEIARARENARGGNMKGMVIDDMRAFDLFPVGGERGT